MDRKVIRCSHCKRETYSALGSCPHCGANLHTGKPPEMRGGEDVQSALLRQKLKQLGALQRDGNWIVLPIESARQHPLYGIGGWAVLLFIGIYVGSFWEIYQVIIPLYKVISLGNIIFVFLAGSIIDVVIAWGAGIRLLLRRPDFQLWFFVSMTWRVILGFAITSYLFGMGVFRISNIDTILSIKTQIFGFVGAILWLTYVIRSKRINITTRNRVRLSDPFVKDLDIKSSSGERLARAEPSFEAVVKGGWVNTDTTTSSNRAGVNESASQCMNDGVLKEGKGFCDAAEATERNEVIINRLALLKKLSDGGLITSEEYARRTKSTLDQV